MKSKHKAQKVAEWMLKELKRQGKLHRDTAVYEIAEKFGSRSTTYDNKDGNLAIRIDILAAFRELTKDSVVWVQEDRYWRMRTPGDEPGRHQTYTPMSNETFELGFEGCGHGALPGGRFVLGSIRDVAAQDLIDVDFFSGDEVGKSVLWIKSFERGNPAILKRRRSHRNGGEDPDEGWVETNGFIGEAHAF